MDRTIEMKGYAISLVRNRVSFDFNGLLHWFPIATDRIVLLNVPAGSPSRGGDVAVYIFCINQPLFLTPFYLALVSISVVMTLSTVVHSINSPDNFTFSPSVLPVLSLPEGLRPKKKKKALKTFLDPGWCPLKHMAFSMV